MTIQLNNQENSIKTGSITLYGTNTPTLPVTGDIWVSGDYIYLRSNDSTWRLEHNGGWIRVEENSSSSSSSIDSSSSSSEPQEVLPAGGTLIVPVSETRPIGVRFTGEPGETATVVLNPDDPVTPTQYLYIVKNVAGSFVWDFGGLDEHTFTVIGETYIQNAGGILYTIKYDGLGSLRFTVEFDQFLSSSSSSIDSSSSSSSLSSLSSSSSSLSSESSSSSSLSSESSSSSSLSSESSSSSSLSSESSSSSSLQYSSNSSNSSSSSSIDSSSSSSSYGDEVYGMYFGDGEVFE